MENPEGVLMLSIIIPAYNEEKNIPLLYAQIKKTVKQNHEIIFIDDGSTDSTFKEISKLNKKDKSVKAVQFRKNFGKTPALMAGFELAKGDIIITMDADLQDDPQNIQRFLEKMNQGYDVVGGWRYRRKDSFIKKLPSKLYNFLARKLTGVKLHDFNCGFKAYKKEVLKDISLYGEMHRYIPVFTAAQGYKVTETKVIHHERKYGKSKYGFWRLLKGFLDLLYVKFWLDYSTRPIHFFGGLGVLQYIVATLIFIEQIIKAYLIKALYLGPLLILGVLFTITGTLCILFGFLAEIQIRTYYSQSKNKTYAIKRILK